MITILGLVTFTVKAMCIFDISKVKKVLLIIVQLFVYFILYAIWLVTWFFMFSDGINL